MSDAYNEFAKKHGAKKEFYDEDLKFKYQSKSLREYSASIYGLPFQEFPVAAFTSEASYLQWCIQVSGMMPISRKGAFRQFISERLLDAQEEEIPPNTEEGVEVGVVVLTLLKNGLRNCRDFDKPQEENNDELRPGEWIYVETVEENRGQEVFIKFEGLKAKILDQIALGATETKITRKEVVKWLLAHGRYYGRDASVHRRRCAYVLPLGLVESFEVFALRTPSMTPSIHNK
jgi:hypothetical protein